MLQRSFDAKWSSLLAEHGVGQGRPDRCGPRTEVAVGQGDQLIPSTQAARDAIQKATGGKNGWQQTLASGTELTKAPFQSVDNYPKWKDQIATPAFQEFLANKTDLQALGKKLSDGWGQVNN